MSNTDKVTIILGAGAHKPFGFPLGDGLKDDVANQLVNAANNIGDKKAKEHYHTLRRYLLDCGFSIDRFLTEHKASDKDIRPLIAKSLLGNENSHKEQVMADWLKYLWPYMVEKKHVLTKRFVFITFCYDRTVQYKLARACEGLWGMTPKDAAELVETTIPIYHVYGSFGSIVPDEKTFLPYGEYAAYEEAGKRINIIGEKDAAATTDEIHKVIAGSSRFFMLGAGFHSENMKLLSLDKTGTPVNSTCLGFTGPEATGIRQRYPYILLPNNNWDCVGMMRECSDFQECLS